LRIVDVLSKESEKALDYFARSLEKAIRATVMDEMINLAVERSRGVLLTGNRAPALEASARGIEVLFVPGDKAVKRIKAYHMPLWKLHIFTMWHLMEGKELLAKILRKQGVLREYKLSIKEDKLLVTKLH